MLGGALETLNETELVILEVSMFEFMTGAPQFYDVVVYMKRHGFVAYDIFEEGYRPLDSALGQIDIAFAKENGFLRRDHSYATIEQWEKIVQKIQNENKNSFLSL